MAAKKKTAKKAKKTSTKGKAKRKGGRPKAGSPLKSDFIRAELAKGTSPGDIVKLGAAKGINFRPNLVYKLKTKAAKASGAPKAGKAGKAAKTPAVKAKAGSKPTASSFVRQHPGKSAAEVVALGKAAGIKVTEGTVYATRAYDRAKSGAPKGKPGRKPGSKAASKVKDWTPQVFGGGGGGDEADLKKAALAVGFPRALHVVEELSKKYQAVQQQYQALLG